MKAFISYISTLLIFVGLTITNPSLTFAKEQHFSEVSYPVSFIDIDTSTEINVLSDRFLVKKGDTAFYFDTEFSDNVIHINTINLTTKIKRTIASVSSRSHVSSAVIAGDYLYFICGGSGELYKLELASYETEQVTDINGSFSSLIAINDAIYLRANFSNFSYQGGRIMFYSPETGELEFLGDFGDLTNVGKIIEYDGKIIFDATESTYGHEVRVLDLVNNEAYTLDFTSGAGSSEIISFIAHKGELFHVSENSVDDTYDFYLYDLTAKTWAFGFDISLENTSGTPRIGLFKSLDSGIFFNLFLDGERFPLFVDSHINELKNFENMAGSSQMDLVSSVFEVNGIIYFSTVANDNPFAFYSYNPASSEIQDLTSALTPDFPILLSQLGELPPIGELTDFAVHGTTVYLSLYFKTYGTESIVNLNMDSLVLSEVTEIDPASSDPKHFFASGDHVFFSAVTAAEGRELFVSRSLGSALISQDLVSGEDSGNPQDFLFYYGDVYFTALNNGVRHLFKSNPDATSSELVDLSSISQESVCDVVATTNFLFLNFCNANQWTRLDKSYRNLGTDFLGGYHLTDISSEKILKRNDKLYFFASSEIYQIDANREQVIQISLTDLTDVVPVGSIENTLFFTAEEGAVYNRALYSYNTESGVRAKLVESPTDIIVTDNELFLGALDAAAGVELFKFDVATSALTLLSDLYPGQLGSSPANFVKANGRVFFTATNDGSSQQLYELIIETEEIKTVDISDLDGGNINTIYASSNGLFVNASTQSGNELYIYKLNSKISNDVDGDGKSDILWRSYAKGWNFLWAMDGIQTATVTPINVVPEHTWDIVGQGDYDADGKSDIFWRNRDTGHNFIYLMDGAVYKSRYTLNYVGAEDWRLAGSGDFDGDGIGDVLWHNVNRGDTWFYLMEGGVIRDSLPSLWVTDLNYGIAATGDIDGDGDDDVIWRNTASGINYVWIMQGGAIANRYILNSVNTEWDIAGTGDLDGDGTDDIILRNKVSGDNWAYFMEAGLIRESTMINKVADTDWKIANIGDYDGDGKADFLWRHAPDSKNLVHLMDGITIKAKGVLRTSDDTWQVAK